MKDSLSNIPSHWKIATLKSISINKKNAIVDGPFGTQMKVHEFVSEGIPVVEMSNIRDDVFYNQFRRFITESKLLEIERSKVIPGDVIISKTGSLGYIAIIPDSVPKAIITSRLAKLSIDWSIIVQKFLCYYLLHLREKGYWEKIAKGTTMKILNISQLANTVIPLPPLTEQNQIVSKMEELFSELDNGIANMKEAKEQLKVYRQSVLKWAFEGKLTNDDVKDGDLPKGWYTSLLSDISQKITDGEHFRPKTEASGVYFLSAKDIRDYGVDFSDPLYISADTAVQALRRCDPKQGDILIVSRGATVGRMCIVKTNKTFCLLGSVILIRIKNQIDSRFITYALKSPDINRKIIQLSGSTAQQAIYLRDIKKIEIPICELDEQLKIVQEIETRFSIANTMEQSIDESLMQAEALRQSILKIAFEGRLVW